MTLTQMDLDEFLHLASTAPRLYIYREIASDGLTPPDVFESLQAMMDDGTVFETDVQPSGDGGVSIIALGLMAQLSARGHDVTIRVGHKITQHSVDPLLLLRQMLAQYAVTNPGHPLLLEHGAMGFLSYDAVRMREAIDQRHALDSTVPDMLFNFYHTVIIFDHVKKKMLVAKMVELDGCDLVQVYQHTQRYLSELIENIRSDAQVLEKIAITKKRSCAPEVDVSDDEFMRLITQAKHHIRLGDAFQIVLSRCFKQTYTVKPFAIYRALRQVSPTPYLFYFSQPSFVMLAASPEKLVSVRHHQVEINPIAGTRARRSVHDEHNNANELLADEKN